MTAASRIAALIVCVAARAHAQAPSEADVAFKKGRELLKAGKYAEACVEFEKSESLDPQLGTRYNIAQCDEKTGKLAAALELYRELADKDTNAQRKHISADAAAALDKRVPRVQLQIDNPPPGLVVKLGERTVPCTGNKCEVRVDRGHYEAVASSAGYTTARASVDVDAEGATVIVKLVLTKSADHDDLGVGPEHAHAQVEAQRQPTAPPTSHRKLYASVAMGVGGAAIATGVVFGVLAHGNWNDAKAACGGSTSCPDSASLAKANSLRDSANSKATIATVLFVAGGIAAGAGVVLYVTAPSSEHAVAVAPAGTGVSLVGRF